MGRECLGGVFVLGESGWLLKLCQMFFSDFSLPDCCQIVARLLPDCCQIGQTPVPDLFLQISRFPKKSGTDVQTLVPDSGNNFQIARLCQILATNSYVASTMV